MQTLNEKIDALIRPSLEARGFRLVRVKLMEQYKRKTLQIMAERQSDGQMKVEDCTELNHVISALLDVDDPIEGRYDLEVSSPGIDRPLVSIEDFTRYSGHEAKLETHGLIEGRKRFKGVLGDTEGDNITITVDSTEYHIPLSALATAQLILTDALIAAHQKSQPEVLEIANQ